MITREQLLQSGLWEEGNISGNLDPETQTIHSVERMGEFPQFFQKQIMFNPDGSIMEYREYTAKLTNQGRDVSPYATERVFFSGKQGEIKTYGFKGRNWEEVSQGQYVTQEDFFKDMATPKYTGNIPNQVIGTYDNGRITPTVGQLYSFTNPSPKMLSGENPILYTTPASVIQQAINQSTNAWVTPTGQKTTILTPTTATSYNQGTPSSTMPTQQYLTEYAQTPYTGAAGTSTGLSTTSLIAIGILAFMVMKK